MNLDNYSQNLSNLDDYTVYVFVRQDLPVAQQLVQSAHAVFHLALEFRGWRTADDVGIPFVVMIGVPHVKALAKAEAKMKAAGIPYRRFIDTDISDEPSALATFPLDAGMKEVFENYRLWNARNNIDITSVPIESPADVQQVIRA